MNQGRKSRSRDLTKGWSQRLASGWMLFVSSTAIGVITAIIIVVALGNTGSTWFLVGTALLNEWEVVLSWRHEAKTASLQSSSQETRHHQEIPVSDT